MQKLRRIILLCGLNCLAVTAFAQSTNFGVSGGLNTGFIAKNNANLSSNAGIGGGLFFDIPFLGGLVSTELQYDHLRYFQGDASAHYIYNQIEGHVGTYLLSPQRYDIGLAVHGVYSIGQSVRTTTGLNPTTVKTDFNQYARGLRLTAITQLTQAIDLRFSYTADIASIQSSPLNHFKISAYYSFKAAAAKASQPIIPRMSNGAVKASIDSLSSSSLYVVRGDCDPRMTHHLLDSLFSTNYQFSAYEIISAEEVDSVRTHHEPLFFAYVGSLYGGLEEPEACGIFLMDKHFNLTTFPYPVQTSYFASLIGREGCFGQLENSARTIRMFNRKLFQIL